MTTDYKLWLDELGLDPKDPDDIQELADLHEAVKTGRSGKFYEIKQDPKDEDWVIVSPIDKSKQQFNASPKSLHALYCEMGTRYGWDMIDEAQYLDALARNGVPVRRRA